MISKDAIFSRIGTRDEFTSPPPHPPSSGSATYLQSYNNRIEIENRLPVFSQNVEAHLALEINIWVVDLFAASHLGRLVREVLVDSKRKCKGAASVHALVRLYRKDKVEDVVWVGELGLHGRSKGQLREVWRKHESLVLAR